MSLTKKKKLKEMEEKIKSVREELSLERDEAIIFIITISSSKHVESLSGKQGADELASFVSVILEYAMELGFEATEENILAINESVNFMLEENGKDFRLKIGSDPEGLGIGLEHYRDALSTILIVHSRLEKEGVPEEKRISIAILMVAKEILTNRKSDRSILNKFCEELPDFIDSNFEEYDKEEIESLTVVIRSIGYLSMKQDKTVREVLMEARNEDKEVYNLLKELGLNKDAVISKAIEELEGKLSGEKKPEVKKEPVRKRGLSLQDKMEAKYF